MERDQATKFTNDLLKLKGQPQRQRLVHHGVPRRRSRSTGASPRYAACRPCIIADAGALGHERQQIADSERTKECNQLRHPAPGHRGAFASTPSSSRAAWAW